jgi:hypothetical protein
VEERVGKEDVKCGLKEWNVKRMKRSTQKPEELTKVRMGGECE